MTEKVQSKADALPDLDDLLQCPVCYEIPSGQIFQCNEGHHVCGRCKMRLDVCPVCRAFFFGTRNYAMEELIANVRRLRAFKLGGKVTTGTVSEVTEETREPTPEDTESSTPPENEEEDDVSSRSSVQPPKACKGLFRCLCCKNNPERLPAARLLNHLRYYHSPDLIEGQSDDNGEYLQAWQFSTEPGRLVTAVRISDMGIFFLIIEISSDSIYSWLSMASSPWVAHEFSYTLTLSGNDREAIFSNCVWSVRSCEGSLKKRNRCLSVTGSDARALLAPAALSGKLSVRRTSVELLPHFTQPRAVLRVANRSNLHDAAPDIVAHDLEPFLQDLQNDVARLSRAFATLGREANALVRSEAEMRARLENNSGRQNAATVEHPAPSPPEEPQPATLNVQPEPAERTQLSRNARRRMRQRLREAFREAPTSEDDTPASTQRGESNVGTARTNNHGIIAVPRTNNNVGSARSTVQNTNNRNNGNLNSVAVNQNNHVFNNITRSENNNQNSNSTGRTRNSGHQTTAQRSAAGDTALSGVVAAAPAPAPPAAGEPSVPNGTRNKKKRRHRR